LNKRSVKKSLGNSASDLLKQVEQREAEINVLQEINRRFRDHFEIGSLLREVLVYARCILESEASSAVLLNEETQKLFFYATDDSGAGLESVTLELGQGVVGQVVATGQARIVNDCKTDSDFYAGVDQVTGFVTRSLICVPMVAEGKIIGAMEVLNRSDERGYTDKDLRILDIVASQASLAIEYVRANQKRSFAERMALVGNMAAGVVHDLRNSLSVILGYADLITMQNSAQKPYTEVICREVRKVTEFCQELLEYSRGDELCLELSLAGLDQLMEETFKSYVELCRNENISLEIRHGESAPVMLDVNRMSRVVQNMVSNAMQAMYGGLPDPRIILEYGNRDGVSYLAVEDNGRGMDEETVNNLYQPFFTKGKVAGTGLGMAIVKNIVEVHNATISVKSTVGLGTRFEVCFSASGGK